MLHPGPLVGNGMVVGVEPGAPAALDSLAAADLPVHAFLRSAWFAAGAGKAPLRTLVARRPGSDDLQAAIPFVSRRLGPFSISEVAGAYWPWRSFPLAPDGGSEALADLLAAPEARGLLGRAWRFGPVLADDPSLLILAEAARRSGWTLVGRKLGTCYTVDLAGLTAEEAWPTTKTLRKNRWLERRLAESGALSYRTVTGAEWSGEAFEILARIEAESWVGHSADSRDTKFLDAGNRAMWARATEDPALAEMLGASILEVDGTPVAFTFQVRSGATLHIVANSYSERFREGSPGRILLYRQFQQAIEAGVETIGWGAGDPGYKSEMGAKPGPDIIDLLIVRGRVAAGLAGPLWRRRQG